MATLHFKNVNKIYPNNVQAVFDFNLDVNDKEFIVFVGPSGCGKSTTLRMVAGLEEISSGEIYIDDVLINDVEPKNRDISMVFQNYALYPHLTVFENMAFSLQIRKNLIPVFELDDKEQYEKEVAELKNKIDEELKNSLLDAKSHKRNKDEIDDLKYRLKNKFELEKINLKKKYSKRVYTYDHEKVKELEDKILDLKSKNNTDKDIAKLESEIEQTKNTFDKPAFEYRTFTKDEILVKVNDAAKVLGLETYLKRKPGALSGGQRQRVALGRAIVRNPKVFLMDEPLSNLDAKLRVQMRSEIIKIHKFVGATTIYVTHDQTEAMTMATRIVCMKDGYIQQTGTPKELYNTPANMFVAGFIGSPAMNFINGVFDGSNFVSNDKSLSIKLTKEQVKSLDSYKNKEIVLGIRPEDIYFDDCLLKLNYSNIFEMKSDISELLGRELLVYNYLGDQKVTVKTTSTDVLEEGEVKKYKIDLDRVHFFDKDTTLRI